MKQQWDLVEAVNLVRSIQKVCMDNAGYYIALGGGVLNKGYSDNDLDLVAVPRTLKPNPERLDDVLMRMGISKVCQFDGHYKAAPDESDLGYAWHWPRLTATGKHVEFTVIKV